MLFDINKIRSDFPILNHRVGDYLLTYLDNTATSQTPRRVIDEIGHLYSFSKANVHRGVHTLSQEATALQEATRKRISKWINAEDTQEIIFTRGATESINLVAASYGQRFKEGDEIILTVMEHHANIVPWQLLRKHTGIVIRVVDINEKGELDLDQYRSLFSNRTVFASFTHISNVLGTINPVKEMTRIAHENGVPVLIDGAQASPHIRPDVRDIDCDFYVFSSHKMYGPTGIGVLYGRKALLEEMPPYQGGGEMIKHVSFEKTTFADLPFKFEAGTPDFIGIAAFDKAFDFLQDTGMDNIMQHEEELLKYTEPRLLEIPGLVIYGSQPGKAPVISFNIGKAHNYDVGFLLDKMGIAVRTGHHCAQPLMERLNIPGTVRASFAVYNTFEEADNLIKALLKIAPMLE